MDTLTTVLSIIVIVLPLALIAPKRYTVQGSVLINRPRQQIFNYIKFLRNTDNYSKWVMTGPGKSMTYTGTDGTEDFTAAWDSDMKQAGKGEQTIEKSIDGERIDIRVIFMKQFAGVADTLYCLAGYYRRYYYS
jgi:uncharacterized membrane protein